MTKANSKWWVLLAVCLGVFMSLLDVTVVNVALPTIQRSFNASFDSLQWVINIYTLMYASALLLVSKLGDLWGRKRMFIITLVLFTLGSLACSMANPDGQLVLFRAVQGIGGSGMMSLSMSIVASTFTGKDRGLALGIWGSVAGLSTALGPLAGGFLVSAFSWRAIFLVNIPIGVVALMMSWLFIQSDQQASAGSGHVDLVGMLLSTAMMFLLILGLIVKEMHVEYSWLDWRAAGLLGAGILALIAFILLERRLANPMVDLVIFRQSGFVASCIAAFGLGAGLYAFYTYLTVLMQNYMGYTALQTGLRLVLISVFSLVLGPIAGMFSSRISPRWQLGGTLLIGAIGMGLLYVMLGNSATWEVMIPSFILFGIANALINPAISNTAVSSVDAVHIGMASGVVNVFRQFGSSVGVVVLGLALNNTYHDRIISGVAGVADLPEALHHAVATGLIKAGPFSGMAVLKDTMPGFSGLQRLVSHAYYDGMRSVILTAGLIFLVTGLLTFWLLRKHRQKAA